MSKFEELLVNKGLYDSVDISADDIDELEKLLSGSIYHGYNISCYCKDCGEERIFESVDKEIHDETGIIRFDISEETRRGRAPKKEELFSQYINKRYCLDFRCTRDHNHSLLFDLLVLQDKIIKIGQFPSYADISTSDTKKYSSVLGEKYREYKKSVGLFSHGIGIGSFVYLRRIIEKLVFEKYEEVKENLEIQSDEFIHQEFKDKLETLKDYLPETLVENKNVYGIISKGIHELSEEDCLRYYPAIKIGIELILDEIMAQKERERKKKEFSKFVADTTGELKK